MKTKHFLIAVALSGPLCILNSQAQGLYVGLGGGYGFAAGKQTMYTDQKSITGSSGSTEYTSRSVSLGRGINAGLFAGYMFNKNMGAELGISYLMGSKNVFTDETINGNNTSKTETIQKGNMLRLVPAIKMTVGEGSLRPYMKIGFIVGLAPKLTEEQNYTSSGPGGSSNDQDIWEYTGGISMGFHGGIGATYAISEQLSLFGEIAGNLQNWAPKKGTLTTSTNDGVDVLPLMTTRNKEIEFLESYTTNNGTPSDPGQPSKSTKFYLPFSSVGINIGVIFLLGGSQ